MLDSPEIRAALPPELLSRPLAPNWVEAFKRIFLSQAYTWLGAGILMLIALLAREASRSHGLRSWSAKSASP